VEAGGGAFEDAYLALYALHLLFDPVAQHQNRG
jgi:hypothetical protein